MIPFVCTDCSSPEVQSLIATFGFTPDKTRPSGAEYYLLWENQALSLYQHRTSITVDFAAGAMQYRHRHGGGLGQPIAKAIGVKSQYKPHVLDATAGLGKDAFILASLGCQITLLERSPIAAALLTDGLRRARAQHELHDIVTRMTLYYQSAHDYMCSNQDKVDVVYLDPMFPETGKSALSKKDMQAFQALIGADEDSAGLLALACQTAKTRVVVKRSAHAPWLNATKPHYSLTGKSTRFDIYLPER